MKKLSRKERAELYKLTKQYRREDKKTELLTLATSMSAKKFYNSPEWKQLRYRVLKEEGSVCRACGANPRTGGVIQVDHILPRSLYPELAYSRSNLQVLCRECNEGKSNKDKTDWREPEEQTHYILRKYTAV